MTSPTNWLQEYKTFVENLAEYVLTSHQIPDEEICTVTRAVLGQLDKLEDSHPTSKNSQYLAGHLMQGDKLDALNKLVYEFNQESTKLKQDINP